jgi:type I restriction-modification system DNA methylase subunit
MSSGSTKTKERIKATGEVFTPEWLVEEMLDYFPESEFEDHTKTFLDPACGNGNLLVGVLIRKVKYGSTPLRALRTIYGVDIMEDNVLECRQRLVDLAASMYSEKKRPKSLERIVAKNIRLGNTLEQSVEEIFS